MAKKFKYTVAIVEGVDGEHIELAVTKSTLKKLYITYDNVDIIGEYENLFDAALCYNMSKDKLKNKSIISI